MRIIVNLQICNPQWKKKYVAHSFLIKRSRNMTRQKVMIIELCFISKRLMNSKFYTFDSHLKNTESYTCICNWISAVTSFLPLIYTFGHSQEKLYSHIKEISMDFKYLSTIAEKIVMNSITVNVDDRVSPKQIYTIKSYKA
jgi:hypothetical protein